MGSSNSSLSPSCSIQSTSTSTSTLSGSDNNKNGNAKVTLLTSNLGSLGRWAKLLNPILDELGKHWAAIVQFEGDSQVFLCEIFADNNIPEATGSKSILWTCKRMPKEKAIEGKTGVGLHELGKVYLDPIDLYKMCGELNNNNTKYNLVFNNCQSWVHELCKSMGLRGASSFIAKQWAKLVLFGIHLITSFISFASPPFQIIRFLFNIVYRVYKCAGTVIEPFIKKYKKRMYLLPA